MPCNFKMPLSRKPPYVTQKDIARLANVSQSAVTAALGRTDKIRISEETRQKVLTAAAQLNYSPNQSASITRSGRTRQVALIVTGSVLQTVFSRVHHLANSLIAHGFSVIPHELQWMNRTLEQAWDEALAARAEAVVLTSSFGTLQPQMHKRLLSSPVPVVSLCGPSIPGIPLIAPDFRRAFKELTLEVLQSGRERLVFLRRYRAQDPIAQIEWKREERIAGFLDAVKEAGMEKSCEILEARNPSGRPASIKTEYALGEYGLGEILKKLGGKPPEGIICANDNFALGVISAARHYGIAIPSVMGVTGCDGEEWTGYGAIPITTIYQPSQALAEKASEVLIRMLGGASALEDQTLLPCEIVWRESCGKDRE